MAALEKRLQRLRPCGGRRSRHRHRGQRQRDGRRDGCQGERLDRPGHDPALAIGYANRGCFVVAGLKAGGHGHVVVIVPSPPGSRYPMGYRGRLGGVGREKKVINWSWNHRDPPRVDYYAKPVPERH
jgi:hypothetical protein